MCSSYKYFVGLVALGLLSNEIAFTKDSWLSEVCFTQYLF